MTFAIAVVLTLLGVATRLAPHPPNMVAIGALALYAGARLPRWWAYLVPIVAMIASDILLDWGTGYSPLEGAYLMRYATFAVIVALGGWLRGRSNAFNYAAFAVFASTLFYLTTNFAVWAFPSPGHPAMYPHTWAGLVQCYAAGLVFYNNNWLTNFFLNSLIADLLGVTMLFGLDYVAHVLAGRKFSKTSPALVATDG